MLSLASERDEEVGKVLRSLERQAFEVDCTAIGIKHLSKGALFIGVAWLRGDMADFLEHLLF